MASSGLDNIPDELKRLTQWVCWTNDKLPKNPKTGGNAMSNNSSTWSDYETAVKACLKFHFDGVGFMFANGYFGVDMDNVVDHDQDLIDEFVHTLQSYTEYSKSGKGIHIICRGVLPSGGRRKGKVEMYSEGRYFIMTGKLFSDYRDIRNCTEIIKILHSKHLEAPRPQASQTEIMPVTLEDTEIIDKARSSRSGWLFQALYSGSWQGGSYISQSEADLAFLNILAFWTQKDALQMDRIFRSSGLMRAKWDRKQSGTTWGALQIAKSCASCVEVYDPQVHKDEYNIIIKSSSGKADKVFVKKYRQDDTGNAERFYDAFNGHVKYSYINKCWYFWDGKKWESDNSGEIKKLADQVLSDMTREVYALDDDEDEQKQLLKHIKYTASNKGKLAMIKESEHLQGIPFMPGDMDKNKAYFNCQNGIVSLRNGEIFAHDSQYMMSKISFSEYQGVSKQQPRRWLKFLDDITDGDKDLQLYLQCAVGYTITGSNREQCMFFCYGNGRNGKTTFIEIVADLCGSYAANVQVESLMVKNFSGGANSDIARLQGKRFVTSSEPMEGMRFNESLIKQLTGGDRVTARFLYGKEFEFEPEFKLWMSGNTKPIIRGTDDGIWRRLKLIPFNVQIPSDKVDKNLKHKLREELPLILKWVIDGCILWQKNGLNEPEIITESNLSYRQEMDQMPRFIDDCLVRQSGGGIKGNDVYVVYTKWADSVGEYRMSNQKFGREFSKYFDKDHTKKGAVYYGVSLSENGRIFSPYSININTIY